jgi:hypothetical protein
VTDTLEHSARRIAERGRDALVARLRPAFEEAAAAHADVLELDEERLEAMVQRAADNADGLQWRRALASVASEELGIGLGEALGHPAVARAQAIAGAPSFEETLAALEGERPSPEAPESLNVPAVHLHGVPDLERHQGELELRFSPHGLDVASGPEEVVGRLSWEEIRALDVPAARGRLRRRRPQLVVRTMTGEASFEIPGGSAEELREQLASLSDRHLKSDTAG